MGLKSSCSEQKAKKCRKCREMQAAMHDKSHLEKQKEKIQRFKSSRA